MKGSDDDFESYNEFGDVICTEIQIKELIIKLSKLIKPICEEGDYFFIGLYSRGVILADRVSKVLEKKNIKPKVGKLDVSLYRDDFNNSSSKLSKLRESDIPFDIDNKTIIIFDELIYTGRTVFSSIDGIKDYGRPSRIKFATLIDRGKEYREFPIQPDFIGKTINNKESDHINVKFFEQDNIEGVFLKSN